MIAELLVYISKLNPADVDICPVTSRNGTREYTMLFFLRCGSRRATEEDLVAHFQSHSLKTRFES
jgi:hypothetical protein